MKAEKDVKVTDSTRIRLRDMHIAEDDVYSRWMSVLTADQSQVVETAASTDKYEVQLERTQPIRLRTTTALQEVQAARIVYVFGQHISLLSMKLSDVMEKSSKQRRAGARPVGAVVSVLTDNPSARTYEILSENIFHASNIIPCQAKVSFSVSLVISLIVTNILD